MVAGAMILEITPTELSRRLKQGDKITLIDVREEHEKEIADIGGTLVPLGSIGERASEIPTSGEVVIYCRSGGRSGRAVQFLQEKMGYQNLTNLKGGILAWSDEVDSSIVKY